MTKLSCGDVVISLKGRDKNQFFVLIDANEKTASIVNGKERKVTSPKEKNVKHLEKVECASLLELATKIKRGQPVGNERLSKAIKIATKIIRED